MVYDPSLFQNAAVYYAHGRPAYSRLLVKTLASEAGLDGSGRLLDVGCGPGTLTFALADRFEEVIALDPEAAMLAEGERRASDLAVDNIRMPVDSIRWVKALAEDIATLDLGEFRLITFGQSFHWTDRERVAKMVYEILEPCGMLALITHAHDGRPQPEGPGFPRIPHDEIRAILSSYLGERLRTGLGLASQSSDPHEETLVRAGFGAPRTLFCTGRDDIVQDIDAVLANYLSTSFAAPLLVTDTLDDFEAEVRALLTACSPSGLFWDWPGDTQIVLAGRNR